MNKNRTPKKSPHVTLSLRLRYADWHFVCRSCKMIHGLGSWRVQVEQCSNRCWAGLSFSLPYTMVWGWQMIQTKNPYLGYHHHCRSCRVLWKWISTAWLPLEHFRIAHAACSVLCYWMKHVHLGLEHHTLLSMIPYYTIALVYSCCPCFSIEMDNRLILKATSRLDHSLTHSPPSSFQPFCTYLRSSRNRTWRTFQSWQRYQYNHQQIHEALTNLWPFTIQRMCMIRSWAGNSSSKAEPRSFGQWKSKYG